MSRFHDLLNRVRTEGDWERWLDFFLEGVEQTALDAVSKARQLVALIQEDQARISQGGGRGTGSMLRILDHFSHRPIETLKGVSLATGLSYPSVSHAVERLEKMGIVRELTGRKRNRLFGYDAYLKILNA